MKDRKAKQFFSQRLVSVGGESLRTESMRINMVDVFFIIYENTIMKSVEIALI
jgi:ribosomal protein S4